MSLLRSLSAPQGFSTICIAFAAAACLLASPIKFSDLIFLGVLSLTAGCSVLNQVQEKESIDCLSNFDPFRKGIAAATAYYGYDTGCHWLGNFVLDFSDGSRSGTGITACILLKPRTVCHLSRRLAGAFPFGGRQVAVRFQP
jgi:hypothetical protein